jgi:hypothetical protein
MPLTLEKRIDRVEAAIGGIDESRIHYCATDRDAERVWSEAKAAGKSAPMCMVWSSPGLMDTIRLVRGECRYAENKEPLPG